MKFKLYVVAIAVCVLAAWVNVNVIWADERPTRTFYNNKIPYKALFETHNVNDLKLQIQTARGKVQAIVPVVNDEEKDPTQKKGN